MLSLAHKIGRGAGAAAIAATIESAIADDRLAPADRLPVVRDLASGNPDPAMLPPLAPALDRLDTTHKLYGGPNRLPKLVELAEADFAADGIEGDIAIVGGAPDGIERILQTQ